MVAVSAWNILPRGTGDVFRAHAICLEVGEAQPKTLVQICTQSIEIDSQKRGLAGGAEQKPADRIVIFHYLRDCIGDEALRLTQ